MINANRATAIRFVSAIGSAPADRTLFAPDATAWAPSLGQVAANDYLDRVAAVPGAFADRLVMTVEETVAERDAVVVRSTSSGTLITGEAYQNDYFFLLRFDAQGRISHITEFFDTKKATDSLIPAMRRLREGA